MRFEAHITVDKVHASRLKEGLDGWMYSADDPIMGQKPYCYLTNYSKYVKQLASDMEAIADKLEGEMNIPVLSTKIERIVFDSKTGVNEIL